MQRKAARRLGVCVVGFATALACSSDDSAPANADHNDGGNESGGALAGTGGRTGSGGNAPSIGGAGGSVPGSTGGVSLASGGRLVTDAQAPTDGSTSSPDGDAPDADADAGAGGATATGGVTGAGGTITGTGGSGTGGLLACQPAIARAETTTRPVDVVWTVDNSPSTPVVQVQSHLNDFASLLGSKQLDYEIILLSLRNKTSPVIVSGSSRSALCIPQPLAGDANCGNGSRFFHGSVDIRSTQSLEQILGTLGQTEGFKAGQQRGGEAWAGALRTTSTRSFVVVTDDNARLSADQFEHFAGGTDPFSASLTLPPGLLDASWAGAFDGYLFHAMYGWGSTTDASVACTYSGGGQPASSGATYTTLVQRTNGVRAKICDATSAFTPFVDTVASAVVATSRIACHFPIPSPPSGALDAGRLNVELDTGTTKQVFPAAQNFSSCGDRTEWFFDNPVLPEEIVLCPAACDAANASVGVDRPGKINVEFGCATIRGRP